LTGRSSALAVSDRAVFDERVLNVDPLTLAAAMFQPRTTDSFERWAQSRLGTWLTPAQVAINDSVVKNRYTAVPSCHAAGKSRYSAMKVGHFIDSHTIGSAFVVTTAPTSAQVESVLWRELGKVHTAAKLRGRLTRAGYPQWRIGDELVAFGRRPTEVASFQGIHAKFVLIVLEEADGIPEALWIAADTLASSGAAHVLAIGNPDSADSHFAKVVRPGSGWNVVNIDGLRTPNFTKKALRPYPELVQYMKDNGIPPADKSVSTVPLYIRSEWRAVLLSPEWVNERMERWGVRRFVDPETGKVRWREPALWWSKVRGRPPEEGSEGIIPVSWVEAAFRRYDNWEYAGRPMPDGRLILGCDVADTGKDETVMTRRYRWLVESMERIGQQDTETTANRLIGRLQNIAGSIACVDAAGMGIGIVNKIRSKRLPVLPYIGAQKAGGITDITGEFSFANTRSAAYWHLRELLDPVNGPGEVAFPRDEDLLTDLTVPTWKVKTGGVIAVEPKDSVVKKLKRSPDCGDAIVMTFWPDSSTEAKSRILEYEGVGSIDDWATDRTRPIRGLDAEGRRRRLEQLGKGELTLRGDTHDNIFEHVGASGWEADF
jgi:hypothetical protein